MDQKEFDKQLAALEYPFIRMGMSPEEYDEEWHYFHYHREDVKNGTYKPLWKQREIQNKAK